MLKSQAVEILFRLMPADWKKSLSIHLGMPHVQWSLRQLRQFGFVPRHVLDVGAFEGSWARACLDVFPQARITCIEPQDKQQPALLALASQAPNIQVIQTLLGQTNLSQVPFVELGSGSSVFASAGGSAPTKRMMTIDTLIESGRCEPPNLIKLDVQGYEIRVLDGWTSGFDRCQVIQCEISLLPLVPGSPLLHELVDYLLQRGFVMFDVTELIRSPSDGAVWQIDALFCQVDSRLRRERVWR
jgi:FkbM family methyltransferase